MAKKKKTPVKEAEKKPNVEAWVEKENDAKVKAVQHASQEFDDDDQFTVHTLEAMYGQESGFGENRGTRGSINAAGDFQMEKATAERYGLTVTKQNDQRFNLDSASHATAKQIKDLDGMFSKSTNLAKDISTTPISDPTERRSFVTAAYNAGEGRIAKAQKLAKEAGKDPKKWDDVKNFLEAAGASKSKAQEIIGYVENVNKYEKEFEEKSKASEKYKDKDSTDIKPSSEDGHWITTPSHKHIFIERTP